jgi:tRNA (guanine37-N1)-methyltransferase
MTMRIDVLTLFPEAIENYASTSVLGRAREKGIWDLQLHDFREFTDDVHRSVDDTPYGGGAGMVLRADPILRTLESDPSIPRPVIALTPSGEPMSHAIAKELSAISGFTLLCGRYEGFDQRALDLGVDREISVGDFVLAGGELAALCVIESVVRLLPGALGNDSSSEEESFAEGLLEYPHFTKPAEYRGIEVPEVLRSGDHARIARWRLAQAIRLTQARRPDLLAKRGGLTPAEEQILEEFPALESEA